MKENHFSPIFTQLPPKLVNSISGVIKRSWAGTRQELSSPFSHSSGEFSNVVSVSGYSFFCKPKLPPFLLSTSPSSCEVYNWLWFPLVFQTDVVTDGAQLVQN